MACIGMLFFSQTDLMLNHCRVKKRAYRGCIWMQDKDVINVLGQKFEYQRFGLNPDIAHFSAYGSEAIANFLSKRIPILPPE